MDKLPHHIISYSSYLFYLVKIPGNLSFFYIYNFYKHIFINDGIKSRPTVTSIHFLRSRILIPFHHIIIHSPINLY